MTVTPLVLCLVVGAAAGALAVFASLRAPMAAQRASIAALQARLDAVSGTAAQMLELRAQTSMLRHDLRGILSPALLTADRLANSQDPAIRKAGDIVIRTVERATARLADSGQDQDVAKSPLA